MALTIANLPWTVAGIAAVIAAATDLWRFKVYNALTLPMLGFGLLAAAAPGGWPGLRLALLGAGLGFSVLLSLHALGGVGAGDVKLLTALGAWLGPAWLLEIFVASALVTGLYALALVAWQRGVLGIAAELILVRQSLAHPMTLRRTERANLAAEIARPDRRHRLVPFAAMTCVGFGMIVARAAAQPPTPLPIAPTLDRLTVAEATHCGCLRPPLPLYWSRRGPEILG